MPIKQNEGVFYEFDLGDDFFPIQKTIPTVSQREYYSKNLQRQLKNFINANICEVVENETVIRVINHKKGINDIKSFCNFLTENNHLTEIGMKYMVEKGFVDYESMQKAFKTLWDYHELNNSSANNHYEKRRLKI